MSKKERIIAFLLFAVALSLIGYKYYKNYVSETVSVADVGGTYSEAMVGEVKFLSPITAQNDAEKSIAKLLFRGLVKVYNQNEIVPDLAESYTISTDGKQYVFVLKKGLKFSDGQPLTANDISYTIDSIKTPELKSPLYKSWESVEVTVVDENTIQFDLPTAYGPFIYNCDFGIIPAHLSTDEFSKKLIGEGPYQFSKSVKDGTKIKEMVLITNSNYHDKKPYIDSINLTLFGQKEDAAKAFKLGESYTGIFGAESDSGVKSDYVSSRSLGLILNIRDDKLKDAGVRQKILENGTFDSYPELSLTTLDIPIQKAKAEELKKRFESQGIKITLDIYNAVTLQSKIENKDYELLLYGFDFGYDRDPYPYWHSSQVNAFNLSGWSDKTTDILMEDARMLPDIALRNDKYNQIFDTIKKQYLAEFYEPVSYDFYIKNSLHGVNTISGTQASSRFDQIEQWYLKEKRVKK